MNKKELPKIPIGEKIKFIRKNLGLSMKEFGEKFTPPASDSIVSRWERDVSFPNNERLKRIAELGGISVPYLLYGAAVEEAIRDVQASCHLYESKLYKLKMYIDENINNPDRLQELNRKSIEFAKCDEIATAYNNNLAVLYMILKDIKSGKTIENLQGTLHSLKNLKDNNIKLEFESLPEVLPEASMKMLQLAKEINEIKKYDIFNFLLNPSISYKGIQLTEKDRQLISNVLESIKSQFDNYKND